MKKKKKKKKKRYPYLDKHFIFNFNLKLENIDNVPMKNNFGKISSNISLN